MIPEKDVFMFHGVDGFTGNCIIVCYSINPDIFKFIGNSATFIREAKEKHQVIESDEVIANNYWEKKSIEAKKYEMPTLAYLSGDRLKIRERYNEYLRMLSDSVGNTEFTDKIKKSIINAKKSVVCKVKNFFSNNKEMDNERKR